MSNFLKKFTFIIVTYKSKKVIEKCVNCLPKKAKIIIVENSNDKKILLKYKNKKNIKLVLNKSNRGYGAGNNVGLKFTNTPYAFILNPDTFIKKILFTKIENSIKKLNNDFWILGLDNITHKKNNLVKSETVNGHAIILNLSKFKNKKIFDENYFLYNEEIDLCLNIKKKGGKIYSLDTNDLRHLGRMSSGKDNFKMDVFRNWHGYWSYIYFYKKNFGNLKAYSIFFKKFFGSLIQYFFGLLLFNKRKIIMNKYKSHALLTVILGRSAYLKFENLKFKY